MKFSFLVLLIFVSITSYSAASSPQWGVAKSATPVWNTNRFASLFTGTQVATDNCRQLRQLEFVALPGSVFKVEGTEMVGDLLVYRVTTDEYPYPTTTGFFVDSRLLKLTDEKPRPRKKHLPEREAILKALLAAKGERYVWGGNVPQGVPEMLTLYQATGSLSSKSADDWQLHGLDCSGLLYQATDGFTPRNTSTLISFGEPLHIASLSAAAIAAQAKPLDLIVWKGHVIIVIDDGRVIESRLDCSDPVGVRISPLLPLLERLMHQRIPADIYRDDRPSFVMRRWFKQ